MSDEDIFDDEEEKPQSMIKKLGRPPVKEQMIPSIKKAVEKKEVRADNDTYAAFMQPEERGVLNKDTNQVVSTDIFALLAMILNKLERIERNTG